MPGKTGQPGDAFSCLFGRFNEAPAECRGKPLHTCSSISPGWGFNEAPAECRGKRVELKTSYYRQAVASMRPRLNAGENTRWVWE